MIVVWRKRARQDYWDILDFISDRNPAAAERMADLFDRTAERLPDHPHMYRPGRVPGTREAVMHPNYVMIYRITSTASKSRRSTTPASNILDELMTMASTTSNPKAVPLRRFPC